MNFGDARRGSTRWSLPAFCVSAALVGWACGADQKPAPCGDGHFDADCEEPSNDGNEQWPSIRTALGAVTSGAVLHEVAEVATRPVGSPRYSDVSLRYGWVRSAFPTVADAQTAIVDYHASRVDWFYSAGGVNGVNAVQQDFIDYCHSREMKVGGAINTNTTNEELGLRYIERLDRWVGDPFNQDYIQAVLGWGQAQIDAGVDTLVVDDFFHYDETEQEQFNVEVVEPLRSYGMKSNSIASNWGSTIGTDFVARYAFDFHYSDASFVPTPGEWWTASKDHRARRSALLVHPNILMSRADYRQQVALGYAVGAHVIMPWDRYIHNGEREFGDPADYADISGFVRALGQYGYLDGFEDAAVGGYNLAEDRYATAPLAIAGGNTAVSLFARVVPAAVFDDVVIHVVRIRGSGSTTVRLRTDCFFAGQRLGFRLWTRRPYSATQHRIAEQSGDFKPLIWDRTAELNVHANGAWTDVTLPELHPWGTLIVNRKVEWAEGWSAPNSLDVGDVTGDGFADLIRGWESGTNTLGLYVNRSVGHKFDGGGPWAADWQIPTSWLVADVTGDGRADLMRVFDVDNQKFDLLINPSNGTGFGYFQQWADNWSFPRFVTAGDVDGDGRADLIRGSDAGSDKLDVWVNTSTGTRFGQLSQWANDWLRPDILYVRDVTGDGRADLIRVFNVGTNMFDVLVNPSTGTGFGAFEKWADGWIRAPLLSFGDVNGDGRADLIRGVDSGAGKIDVQVHLSTGTEFR